MKTRGLCAWLDSIAVVLAAFAATAGTELVQNGDFEAGSAVGTWGSYSTTSGYSNPGWTVSSYCGLAKPDGTWMTTGIDVGNWALFLQNTRAYAYQDVEVPASGTYRFSFRWTSRPGYAGLRLFVRVGGQLLDSIYTSDLSLSHWHGDIELAAGTQRILFETQGADGVDRATVIDSVSLRQVTKRVWTGGGSSASIADAGNWGGTPGETLSFTANDYLVIGKAATIAVDSDVAVDGIFIDSPDGEVTFVAGGGAIAVENDIVSESIWQTVFACPVNFAGRMLVVQGGTVKFPGGATATYPDSTMRTVSGTALNRTLYGDFTFTSDWFVPVITADNPWIVASGSTVHGRNLTGNQGSGYRILRIEPGANAYFSSVTNGYAIGDIDIDGYMEVSGDMIVNTSSGSNEARFGRPGNTGTVKAGRIAKKGNAIAVSHIPDLIVGSGGFGTLDQHYYWSFAADTTITAYESFEFLGVYNTAATPPFKDWGLHIRDRHQITINVPEALTVTCGIGILSATNPSCCVIRKTGAGTLVMSDSFGGYTGFGKDYGSDPSLVAGLKVDAGTLRVAASGQLGGGTVWLADGARMEVAPGVSISNRIDGNGTIQLADGVTLANNGNPSRAAAVEFATAGDKVTLTAPDGTEAPFVFLTGVNAADLSRFTYADGTLSVRGGALMLADEAAATDYVWNGGASGDWNKSENWLVGGSTATSTPNLSSTIRFENDVPVTVTGNTVLMISKIVTTSGATVTFSCPVFFGYFNGLGFYLYPYNVHNAAVAPVFAGDVYATYPDASLSSANIPSHEFRGKVTFTDNWTVPDLPVGNPFVVAAGTTLSGKTITAANYNVANYHLRIDEGATATFNTVDVKAHLVFKLNGGRLVATGNVNMWKADCGHYLENNVGTVEANAIVKSANAVDGGNDHITFYVTDMVVGSGGFGMLRRDYSLAFQRNSRLTAKADLTIHRPLTTDGQPDEARNDDWGLKLNGHTFTIDTAGHTVTFDSCTMPGAGTIVKEGEGELIMQGLLKQHTDGTILNGGVTTVKLAGALGRCTATVNSGATLRFTGDATTNSYPIVVNEGATLESSVQLAQNSTLTLAGGAVLKLAQNAFFDLSAGTLVLPHSGTVKVSMTSFSNGVATPVIRGVPAGCEANFSAVLPTGYRGAFSVVGDVLYFTPTFGTIPHSELLWNPIGDTTWSTSVAAWLSLQNEQVAFTPYADALVAVALPNGEISLPRDVIANNVTFLVDGGVTLNGAGRLDYDGFVVKDGQGTFTFNATGGLGSQPVIISNGVFRLGDSLTGSALGGSSPFVVAKGGTLDINYNASSDTDVSRTKLTRDKTIRIAGDGYDGRGAIVDDTNQGLAVLSDLILDDDASVGGSKRYDIRGDCPEHVRPNASLWGPGKTLTVKNTSAFGIVNAAVDLGAIAVTNGGVLMIDGSNNTWNVANGIRLVGGGTLIPSGDNAFSQGLTINADSGANTIKSTSGNQVINSPINIANGAKLTHVGGDITYNGKIFGPLSITGGSMILDNTANFENLEVDGVMSDGTVRFRQSGTYNGANITSRVISVAYENRSMPVDIVFKNSNISAWDTMISWGAADKELAPSGSISVGEGTVFTTTKLAIGDDGVSTGTNMPVKTTFSVDGGTFDLSNIDFFVAWDGPNAEFVVNAGVANVHKAVIRLRARDQLLGGFNKARFIQNGGVFNYGGAGFVANYEDNNEDGQILFNGGEMNASANWSIPHWIPTCFKAVDADGWTLNQAKGTKATWNTALTGSGNVTLNGEATLAGSKEVQGAVGGKWTVGDGFTACLQGAASFLGGLALGEGATATVDVAVDRSAVFTSRDFSAEPTDTATCITARFNKALGGTTRGTITHDETFLFRNYAQTARPFGDMNYTAAYAVGQFYVDASAAGEWTFKGKCDDWVLLWIDGESVLASSGRCVEANGTKTLSAGWHSFRHIATDNGGAFGASSGSAYETIGYKNPKMSDFAKFNVENLTMRPAADMGDPNNPNTVRWSHYKGNSSTVTANTFKNQDFAWDFCCITNNLQMLQWYGNSEQFWFNDHVVNRYDGWFLVTAENADKEWTFRAQYDDRCALWIDGIDSGFTGASSTSPTWKITLSRGWHRFEIRTFDNTGYSGPWGGNGIAISYQVEGGAQTQFSEKTLSLSVCPDGYVQGEVSLGANATLVNSVAKNAAVVYGMVKSTGLGATVSGPFKFEGAKLAFGNVPEDVQNLTDMLKFQNAPADMLANLSGIEIDFAGPPSVDVLVVSPAYGLTRANLESKVSVSATIKGKPRKEKYSATIRDGNILIVFQPSSVILIR